MRTNSPSDVWTANETISWGMFGDETVTHFARQLDPSSSSPPPPLRSYDATRKELRDAIKLGQVTARGFRVGPDGLAPLREQIDPEYFDRFSRLTVDAFGQTGFMHPSPPEPKAPVWNGVVFSERQVRTLWPKPTPSVDAWMLADASANPRSKRDVRIADCMAAIGCSRKDARGAFDRLPPDKKRKRGRPQS